MASNYIYKGGKGRNLSRMVHEGEKKRFFICSSKRILTHAHTHTDTEEKFGPEYF